MKVFKFGGASVKDASGIKTLANIVSNEKENLVVVVSAFGKTTNALEIVLNLWLEGDTTYSEQLDNIYNYHISVVEDLFPSGNSVKNRIDNSFSKLNEYLKSAKSQKYDFEYDQIVSNGELWSTIIVTEFLNKEGINTKWIDIRDFIITDNRHRDANVLWHESTERIRNGFTFTDHTVYLTQGFIAGTLDGKTTTLGREGSDFTAAILGNILDAENVTVWKDVPGLMNADPKWMSDTNKIDEMSYREAVEMTFSGAKVIHPKTIKPLQNKNIPLYVKSFLEPKEPGTVVVATPNLTRIFPIFVRKENQLLLSILPNDFSFVIGDNLGKIFHLFKTYGIKVNLVEASAISINVCVDDERARVDALMNDLKDEYSIIYNENTEMLLVRHYSIDAIKNLTEGREVLLEQRTRNNVRFVVRKKQYH